MLVDENGKVPRRRLVKFDGDQIFAGCFQCKGFTALGKVESAAERKEEQPKPAKKSGVRLVVKFPQR